LETPISESALSGMISGMALTGLRPILEIMFGDFMTLCVDQIINHMSKIVNLYQIALPIVIRCPMGAGRFYGPTHSQSLEKIFLGIPGISVVSPSLFHDVYQVFISAVRENVPTIFIEHKDLYAYVLDIDFGYKITYKDCGLYPIAIVQNYDYGKEDVSIFAYGGVSLKVAKAIFSFKDQYKIKCYFPSLISNVEHLPSEQLGDKVVVIDESIGGFDWGSEVGYYLRKYNPIKINSNGAIVTMDEKKDIIQVEDIKKVLGNL